MKNKPTIIIAGLILKNNKVLCIRQDKGDYKDFIWAPAGHLEPNETLEEGVIREVKEETGLDVKVKKLVMKVEYSQLIFYFYFCDIIGGKLSTKGEIKEIFWLSFNKILKSNKVHPVLYLVASLSIHKPNFYKGIK
jgi:ADP-ribose pyrophosphatase YjhB (NUDIX family)